MTPAGSDICAYYQMLQIQFIALDDGRKHRPKHVEHSSNSSMTPAGSDICAYYQML
jgi:hypothetical protein